MRRLTTIKIQRIAAAFMIFATLASLFTWMASYVTRGQLLPFDEPVMRWLRSHSSDTLDGFLYVITQVGGGIGVTLLTLGLVAGLVYYRRLYQAWFVAIGVAGAGLLNVILKVTFERARPDFWEHLVYETSYSFPSGHAMGSSAFIFVVGFLLWRTKWRWMAVAIGATTGALIGVSRMYLGVHYPSDILAGWIVSFVWICLVYGVLYGYKKRKQTKGGDGQDKQAAGD
jgi:membrane-associated phospholipid phosphatase